MDRDTVDEIKHHFGIIAEDLRGDIRAVAEGQALLRKELVTFREDVGHEFEETRALIRLSYAELDRRVRTLESDVAALRNRLDRVEGRLAS